MDFYLKSKEEVFKEINASESGLTAQEAQKRLETNGKNELEKGKKKSTLRRFVEQLTNPMIIVLLIASGISLLIAILEHGGVQEYAEAFIILSVVILNSILGVYQESKAEKAIEALQEMSAATAKVRRGGVVSQVSASELVVGDIVLIEAGDSIPADMRLIQSASLKIEEAALTGESVPSEKTTEVLKGDDSGKVSLGDRRNMSYMGCPVVYGRGEAVVTATGMSTEMGKIATIIQSTEEGETPLQRKLSTLSKFLSAIVLVICLVIFGIQLITAKELNTEVFLGSFMLAISLAVAAIPEGLAAVVTIVLSIGVTNMAKRNAIIRRLTAVETLGCAQIICSDKTGTLTQNKMTVVESYGDTTLLAKAMALCCDSELAPDGGILGDPTENALVAFALKEGFNKNQLVKETPRVAEAPFDSVRKMMSTLHKTNEGIVQYTKGAPDEVLRVCSHALIDGNVVPLTSEILGKITLQNSKYADKALRVLACAFRNYGSVPEDCAAEKIETDLTFIGLEAMIDPVRPEVKAAVDECKSSGIKVVMITGDHKDTAAAIAKELGIIENINQAMTGRELDELSDEEFEKKIENTFVYARVQPEHKVKIVNMWKKKGFVTAMTGDGVNDAPAIKSGDIGVGMGITGTDVTKNVADMVLADDNFASIVHAVEEGRRIYDNIKKTLQFLLATNFAEVVSIFIATMAGFVLFKPVHLLYINLVTDALPAVGLGMEFAEKGVMKQPPRSSKEGLFADGLGINIVCQGIMIAGLTLASYFIVNAWEVADITKIAIETQVGQSISANISQEQINEAISQIDKDHIDVVVATWGTTVADAIDSLLSHAHTLAMTAALMTLAMCELVKALATRSLKQHMFSIKRQNKVLWASIALSLALTLMIIYVPFLAEIFSLAPLSPRELGVSLVLAIAITPMIEILKAIQRAVDRRR